MIKTNKGFTLIELLVVIAIIGILSSVVLASLSSARNRGKDAAVKSGMASARVQVEILANGGAYSDWCNAVIASTSPGALIAGPSLTPDPTLANIIANITANNSTGIACTLGASGNTIALSAVLPTNTGSWCVDSSGYNTDGTLSTATGGICMP